MRCPFSGKPCLKTKDIYVTEIIDGKTKHFFLCEECGADYIESIKDQQSQVKHLQETISESHGSEIVDHELTEDLSKISDLPCPSCGKTIKQIEDGNKGCEHCHDFQNAIKTAASNVSDSDSTEEKTEVPLKYSLAKEIEDIEAKLEECIEIEWYEEADKITTKLKKLRKDFEKEKDNESGNDNT